MGRDRIDMSENKNLPVETPARSEPSGEPPLVVFGETRTVLEAILFTDIEGSVRLEQEIGTKAYAEVLRRHGELFYEALSRAVTGNVEKHTGDGFMARFGSPSDAVTVALHFQWLLRRESWGRPRPLRVRIGIHQGEFMLITSQYEMPSAVGAPVNLAARVQSLGQGGQVLLTRGVFDNARQFVRAIPNVPAAEQAELGWQAHGPYLLKGIEGPVEIFEVGERGFAPFEPPPSDASAKRSVSAEEEAALGWRPAKSMEVPKRPGWFLQQKVGEGGFGEVWLAENRQTSERRVFKFCFDVVRLRSFKRELLLFRLIREALGPRRDIVTLYEVQIDTPPFFLESEYCSGGTLAQWFQASSANGGVPVSARLEIIARIARALAAAHSVGIIHKDVKPSNIFIEELGGGVVRPRLADFGIGVLIDRATAAHHHLTMTGGLTVAAEPSRTGTRMYSAPEYMVDRPPSIQGDIYSLGVLLFQILVGDFERPLGPGWRRDIGDPLLVEDIAMCVDVEPQRRFSSALQVAEQLETLEQRRTAVQAEEEAARREEAQRCQLETFRKRVRLGVIGSIVALTLIGALSALVLVLDRSRKDALKNEAALKVQREIAEDRAYVADMQTATDDMAQRRGEMTREIIERYRPKPGERDRRGWEWFFVDSVLNTPGLAKKVSTSPLRAMAVSVDEKHVAVGGDDGEVSIWSSETLERMAVWRPSNDAVRALAWQSAGALAIGLASGEVSVVATPLTPTETQRWQAHRGAVNALDWHPRLGQLASGGADGRIAFWSPTGEPLREARKEAPVQAVAWQPDGSELAALYGQPLHLVVASPEQIEHGQATPLNVDDSPLVWRPGGKEVAIASRDLPMRSWDPRAGGDSFSLPGFFSAGGTAYAWSPNGSGIAVGSVDGKIVLVDVRLLAEPRIALYGHKGPVAGLRWLGKPGERLVSIGQDGTLRVWTDLWQAPQITQVNSPETIADAQWHPGENKLALLIAGDEVRIARGDSGETEQTWVMPPPHSPRTPYRGGRIAWSPDGKWLVAISPGRPLAVWNAGDGSVRIPPATGDEREVQWMADSRRLLVRGAAGWSWCAVDGGKSAAIPETENVLWMAGVEGEQIGMVTRTGRELRFVKRNLAGGAPALDVALPAELGIVRCGVMNPTRSLLALGGETGTVAWVDTRTGAASRPAITHGGAVHALGWHPDGSRLASTGADALCRIFNIAQTAQTWVIAHKLQSSVVATGWSADGRQLLLASSDPSRRLVKLYDASLSMDLAQGVAPKPAAAASGKIAVACATIARESDDDAGWLALAREIRKAPDGGAQAGKDLLLAAMELGAQGRFSMDREPPSQTAAQSWEGVPLPMAVQVAQACVLRRWEEVVQLCRESRETWFLLARAEALLRLDRRDEAEAANLAAWHALRRQQGTAGDVFSPSANAPGESVNLGPWANIKLNENWCGGENNHLASLPALVPQPDGIDFRCGDFLQLASKGFRVSGGHMLPRSTGWMPFARPARRVAAMVASCQVNPQEHLDNIVIGSLFLLRSGGRGAVRIPLAYGRNIWDWWSPAVGWVTDATPEVVAWRGMNEHAEKKQKSLALFRIPWGEQDGQPVVAASIVSHLRAPAPMLMALSFEE